MLQSRKNRSKKSKKGTVVSHSHHLRTAEKLMNYNLEIMFEFLEWLHTEGSEYVEEMPYDILDLVIDNRVLGITVNMSIVHRQVTESRLEEFIASEFYDNMISMMIEEIIEGNRPYGESQFRVLPHPDFIGYMLQEGHTEEED
ncbi:MAG TPA: hypothetical protein VNW06_02090 [Cytophagaceae bacterium]|jgi:hypothetical protein|nr:hypothetical protein [Cytophagaceae bacterium]